MRFVDVTRESLLSCPFMNILIENSETLEYFINAGEWTKNPRDGKCFQAVEAAVQAAKREVIDKFNIVGHIPATNQFINMDRGRGRKSPVASPPEIPSEEKPLEQGVPHSL